MNLSEGAVGGFCTQLLRMRSKSLSPHSVAEGARLLALAVADEVKSLPSYNPLEDRRVTWANEVLGALMRGEKIPRASAPLESTIEYMIGDAPRLCGKDMAAGGDR